MKKYFFLLLAAVYSFAAFAQTQGTRKLRAWHDGMIIWQMDAALVDSLNFFIDTNNGSEGDDNTGSGDVANDSAQIFVGVVAFNKAVNQLSITSDVESAKTFITSQTNDQDFTAFAYSVSKGSQLFSAEELPAFDKVFMLNFSDGTDNYSNMLWGMEGRMVKQANVYDTVQYDLAQCTGLNSYAIGFGDDAGFGEKMRKVVRGSGTYRNAETSADLQTTFNEIAQSIIASAKNVVLTTNPGFYSEDMGYKYFRFTFVAEGGFKDTIYAQMEGTPFEGFTLSITKAGQYAQFDAPVQGTYNEETGKVSLPLNHLKFVSGSDELQFSFEPYVSFDGELYYADVEEASTSEDISKRIAVVLVLDCSKSMGDAFTPMKDAAIDFIETLEAMDPSTSEPDVPEIPDVDETGVQVGGITYILNGGTLATAPDNEALWEDFKPNYNTYYGDNRANQPITAIAVFMTKGQAMLTDEQSGWKWLGDYILLMQPTVNEGANVERNWRYTVDAFFNCRAEHWAQIGDWTEAGKPTNWQPYYIFGNAPTKEGCAFAGWYSDKACTQRVTTLPETGTLYAKWVEYEYVDLGLTSGTLWATFNVGATAPEEYGNYFAWGETQPKSIYDWSASGNYKWGVYDSAASPDYGMTKYNSTDGKTVLDPEDDAATANWGGAWRMPTQAEQQELIDECTWSWTTLNGVYGYRVISKKDTSKSIFLPAAGFCRNSGLGSNAGTIGYYWTSSLNENCPYYAYEFYIYSSNYNLGNVYDRYFGQSVRPVCSSTQE